MHGILLCCIYSIVHLLVSKCWPVSTWTCVFCGCLAFRRDDIWVNCCPSTLALHNHRLPFSSPPPPPSLPLRLRRSVAAAVAVKGLWALSKEKREDLREKPFNTDTIQGDTNTGKGHSFQSTAWYPPFYLKRNTRRICSPHAAGRRPVAPTAKCTRRPRISLLTSTFWPLTIGLRSRCVLAVNRSMDEDGQSQGPPLTSLLLLVYEWSYVTDIEPTFFLRNRKLSPNY